jgi:hypothetical protein
LRQGLHMAAAGDRFATGAPNNRHCCSDRSQC